MPWIGVDENGFICRKRNSPLSEDVPGISWHEIDEATSKRMGGVRHHDNGPLKWRWDGSSMVETLDTRRLVRFSGEKVTDGPKSLLLEGKVGDDPATINVECVDADGNLQADATWNELVAVGDRKVRVSIANGRGSIMVPMNYPRDVMLGNNPNFLAVRQIRVVVTPSHELGESEL